MLFGGFNLCEILLSKLIEQNQTTCDCICMKKKQFTNFLFPETMPFCADSPTIALLWGDFT